MRKTEKHGTICGGEVNIFYDELRWYIVCCVDCGELLKIKTDSMDSAIKIWNRKSELTGCL